MDCRPNPRGSAFLVAKGGRRRYLARVTSRIAYASLAAALFVVPALAFSPDRATGPGAAAPHPGTPSIAPGVVPAAPAEAAIAQQPAETPPTTDEEAPSGEDADLPAILRSEAELPAPVREMRQQLIEAAKSGDMERLRALMQAQAEPPAVSFGNPGDPIEYLKALSSDAEGREILAILLEVLESGFVHVQPGAPEDEIYVWPYFAQYPLEALTPEQLVELFTLVTAGDYEDMKSYGSYTFFRVGIAPDGRWLFFLAGD
jgi:hypothetical protein